MKKMRFFMLLLLVPCFLYARGIEEYTQIRKDALKEWEISTSLITRCANFR